VLAEWCFDGARAPSLHVHCHVSGEERWLAPPALRNFIFQREMPLVRCTVASLCCVEASQPLLRCHLKLESISVLQVLDTVIHADRLLFSQMPHLAAADVFLHLSSHVQVRIATCCRSLLASWPSHRMHACLTCGSGCLQELNMTLRWGKLSQRASWPLAAASPLQTWWQYLRMPAGSRVAAAAAMRVQAATGVLPPATKDASAEVLLADGTAARSNGAEALPELVLASMADALPQDELLQEATPLDAIVLHPGASLAALPSEPSQDLLQPPADQCLQEQAEDIAGSSEAVLLEGGVVLPATARALLVPDAARADSLVSMASEGVEVPRNGSIGGEACSASNADMLPAQQRHSECSSSSSSRSMSGLGRSELLPDSSMLRCAAADGWSQPKPITVRDIVSEWTLRGHEVVTVRR
jgi:hypothetical protein